MARNRAFLYHILLGFPFWLSVFLTSVIGGISDAGVEIPGLICKNIAVVVAVAVGICTLGNRILFQIRDANRGWNIFVNFLNVFSTIIMMTSIFVAGNGSVGEGYIVGTIFLVPIGIIICALIGGKIGEYKSYK